MRSAETRPIPRPREARKGAERRKGDYLGRDRKSMLVSSAAGAGEHFHESGAAEVSREWSGGCETAPFAHSLVFLQIDLSPISRDGMGNNSDFVTLVVQESRTHEKPEKQASKPSYY